MAFSKTSYENVCNSIVAPENAAGQAKISFAGILFPLHPTRRHDITGRAHVFIGPLWQPTVTQGGATPRRSHEMQLLVRPPHSSPAESFGFQFLRFRTAKLTPEVHVQEDTGEYELGLVLLGGKCTVESSRGTWTNIGRRPNVF